MFTGLIEAVGTVRRLTRMGRGARLELGVQWPDAEPPGGGDSVAVDGACLTVLDSDANGFNADLSPETLSRTMLGDLRGGQPVNLERALRLGDRLGGHLVQGHVDAVVRLLAVDRQGEFERWRLALPAEQAREVSVKGSITVHGVSLTVAELDSSSFEVALIPETLAATTLGGRRPGERLHLETDVLAKYVVRALTGPSGQTRSALDEMFGAGVDDA
jgi:riboflavin synthase